MTTTDMNAAATSFFKSSHYAVAGASSEPYKFGHKIFVWYLQNSITPIPLNPRAPSITARSNTYPTVPSPSALPNASTTSLSVITPPSVTKSLLKEAKEAGIRAVWLQPGAFDDEILEQAKKDFPGQVVAGFEGLKGRDRHEGWCLLVHGEDAIEGAKKEGEGSKL